VERLDERLERDLPVAGDLGGDVEVDRPVRHRPAVALRRERRDVVLERLGVRVGVDEDEPLPGADPRLRQVELLRLHVAEVPDAGDVLHRAVQVPREAVERTPQLGHVAALAAELAAPVQAGVEVGADLVRAGPHDDQRVAGHLVEDVVADLRELVGPAGELPRPAPDLLDLGVVPGLRDVAVHRDVLGAQRLVDVDPQDAGDRAAVPVQILLDARSGRSGRHGRRGGGRP
jgi:hypothetical protein